MSKVIFRNFIAEANSKEAHRTDTCHRGKKNKRRFMDRGILVWSRSLNFDSRAFYYEEGSQGCSLWFHCFYLSSFCFLGGKIGLQVSRIWFSLICFRPIYFKAIIIQLKSLILLGRGKLLPSKNFAGGKESINANYFQDCARVWNSKTERNFITSLKPFILEGGLVKGK